MAAQNARPSFGYVERQLLTRLPATPDAPSTKNSNAGGFDGRQWNGPAEGTPVAGDGLVLANVFAIVVSVYANVGQTLSGGGNLLCWVYNPYAALWTRAPAFDIDMSALTAAANGFTNGALWNISRLGMLINWLASSVTVSGGTDILVRVDGFASVGSQGV